MKNNLSENESKVLEYLKNNRCLTTFEAVVKLKIMNVADVIKRLRDWGYNIPPVDWKTSKNKKRYAEYKLARS